MRFDGFCSGCYVGERPNGRRRFTNDEVRAAWRWLFGEQLRDAANETLAKTFKPVPVTDEQRDRYIEIVNYEADRTNQIDSVPEKYRVEGMRL